MESSPKVKPSLDILKLIQPDLLSHKDLVDILRERGIGCSLLTQNKDKLVSLFKRVAMPLPQRELRQNYRGSLLLKLRKKVERLIINESSGKDTKSYTVGVSGSAALVKSDHEEKHGADRLKPPPDVTSSGRKKIRLNSNISAVEKNQNTSNDLNKIVITKRKTSESSSSDSSDKPSIKIKKISLEESQERNSSSSTGINSSSKEVCNGTKNKSVPKKIQLKRNHLSSKPPTPSVDSTDKTTTEPDKKRKPITWP